MKYIVATLLLLVPSCGAYAQDRAEGHGSFAQMNRLYDNMEREYAPKKPDTRPRYIEDVYGNRHYYDDYGPVTSTVVIKIKE